MCMALNTETNPQINGFVSQESKHIHVGWPGPSKGSTHFVSFFSVKEPGQSLDLGRGVWQLAWGLSLHYAPGGIYLPLNGFQWEKGEALSSGVFILSTKKAIFIAIVGEG